MISTVSSSLEKLGLTSQERVEKALQHLQNGKGIVLIADEDWENEGNLIFSAHQMNVQDMALMIRACNGIVCLCLTNEKADQLDLPYMIKENQVGTKLLLPFLSKLKKVLPQGFRQSIA